ncbi:hypothetical protein IG631_14928 [Alternaria alternata]|nr:hypothetical protein IG631_14928 [Alternaria alternata]
MEAILDRVYDNRPSMSRRALYCRLPSLSSQYSFTPSLATPHMLTCSYEIPVLLFQVLYAGNKQCADGPWRSSPSDLT